MLSKKIIATEITNLTDARYFAAWGADYIAFVADPNSDRYIESEVMKEILEWVEGPTPVLEYSGLQINQNAHPISHMDINHFYLSRFIDDPRIENTTVFRQMIVEDIDQNILNRKIILKLSEEDLQNQDVKIQKFLEQNEVYLDMIADPVSILMILKRYAFEGLVIKGSNEEKLGFKSYEDIDKILEGLMEYV